MHLKGERVDLGSQFKVTVHPSQEARVIGAYGSHWPCISSGEPELNELTFPFLYSPGNGVMRNGQSSTSVPQLT